MKRIPVLSLALAGALVLPSLAAPTGAQEKQVPQVKIPDAGVPQIGTIEGKFVRAAYNNEGYVILGYQAANYSVGGEWMLLDMGATVRDGQKDYTLTRDSIWLDTPDAAKIPLASVQDYRNGNVRALENRAKVQSDSINYFPPSASQACRIGFFSQLEQGAHAWDQVELTDNRGCVGRVFFQIPGGIKYGQDLAQRAVRGQLDSRAVPRPHEGRGEDAVQELQGHPQAGPGSVQAKEENQLAVSSSSLVSSAGLVTAPAPHPLGAAPS